jgi:hypothetical protein
MTNADRIIRWSTATAVVGVAAVAVVVSYERAYVLVHAHGEAGRAARLIPLTSASTLRERLGALPLAGQPDSTICTVTTSAETPGCPPEPW